jgi:hypothetical protein
VIRSKTNVFVDEKIKLKITVNNQEKEAILDASSSMYVAYSEADNEAYGVTLFLDYAQAKKLAEGILARLDEMKYKS